MTPANTGTLIGQTLGGYELVSLLGAGGMAEVYLAKDPKLDRDVAVKVLPAFLAMDAGYVERFRDEARRVAALNHPNVVPVYHYGEERGLLFLVMPVLRESLRDRMERDGVLPISEAARYTVQIAAALDAAHAQGLVHRDVKPENILINAEGKALLTDFGIAREASFLKQTGSNRTLAATGLPVGTPEYMAPEQLRAGLVDQRADIYALGSVLYEMLTGTVPHEAPTPYEVAALVLTSPLTPPSRRNPTIWPQLEQVVVKALASDPNGRYPSTRTFAMAVRDAVLHRDSSVLRLTMPAVSSEVPAFGTLGIKSKLDSDPSRSAPTALVEDAPTEVPAPALEPLGSPGLAWREDFQPKRPGGRKALLVVAIVTLVLAGACGGSGIAILNGFTLPFVGSGFQPPFFSSSATNSANATATANATNTTGSGGIALATTTAGPGATATTPGGPPPVPTSTPVPNPTATPIPPNLSFSSTTITLTDNGSGFCTGSQQITNNSQSTVSWTWKGAQPPGFKHFGFSISRSGSLVTSGGWPPRDSSMPAAVTDSLTVWVQCQSPQTYPPNMVTDNLGDSYQVTLVMQ